MHKLLIAAAALLVVTYRPKTAAGAVAPSIADQLGFGGLADAIGKLPFLGGSPQGPWGSGYTTPPKNGVFANRLFISPYDAARGGIGGWGGGIGNQYDPSRWDGYSAWMANRVVVGNGLVASDFSPALPGTA